VTELTRFKSVSGRQRMLIQLYACIRSFFFVKCDHKSADNENNNDDDDDDESNNSKEIKFSWLFIEQFLIRRMSQKDTYAHICFIKFFLILFTESVTDGTFEGVSQPYTHIDIDKIH